MNRQRESAPDSRRGGTSPGPHEYDDGSRPYAAYAPNAVVRDRGEHLAREQEAHGGIKVGFAFIGWLTATGIAVLLTAVVASGGTAVGVSTGAGLFGDIVLAVIVFAACFCGGYVAGRMSRFNGLTQGLAVWLWAVVIALGVAGGSAVAGSRFDVLSGLNSFPMVPVDGGILTTSGLIALVVVAIASLAGALVGGVAGMHFHRRVDRVGLGR